MNDDESLIPTNYRDQIGRRYSSPHEAGYAKRLEIVIAYGEELAARGESVTSDKIGRMLKALNRGYSVNAKTISLDMAALRHLGLASRYPNGHRIQVIDGKATRTYSSLRQAAKAERYSVEAARRHLLKPGQPNSRGQLWSYLDPPGERPKPNRRPKQD